jgi:hypothetical protein
MESRAEIIVHYTRGGGRKPPHDREQLEIRADGSFSLWRSIGSASYPPAPVGRFAGQLDPSALDDLRDKVMTATRAGNLSLIPPPGAAIEKIRLGKVEASLGIHQEPEGPWGTLVEHLRQLLTDLTNYPRAAVALEVDSDGRSVYLVHLGEEALRLDLKNFTIRAVLWQGYQKEADWQLFKKEDQWPDQLTAQAGWSFKLPFDHNFQVTEGREVVAYVTLSLFDGETAIPVALESRRLSEG